MSRFPPIPPSQLTPNQKVLHEKLDEITKNSFSKAFTMKNKEGALIGPMAPMLYLPAIALPWHTLNQTILALPQLSTREKELGVLATVSHTRAAFSTYAHSRVAASAGLFAEQIKDAREGRLPKGLSEREEVAYLTAKELVGLTGPLKEESWQRLRDVLGLEGAAALLHVVAIYMYSSVIFNGGNVPVPEGETL